MCHLAFFEAATVPSKDLELLHTVVREIYEELFGNEDIAGGVPYEDPELFYYREEGIFELLSCLESGKARFSVTGFCIDLVRLVPEITCMLIVSDPNYFKSFSQRFKLGLEFHRSAHFSVPVGLADVDSFLRHGIVTDPDDIPKVYGFDPERWTLPGAFSFYQGLRRGVKLGIL